MDRFPQRSRRIHDPYTPLLFRPRLPIGIASPEHLSKYNPKDEPDSEFAPIEIVGLKQKMQTAAARRAYLANESATVAADEANALQPPEAATIAGRPVLATEYAPHDNPQLAGVRDRYRAMLAAGWRYADIERYLRSRGITDSLRLDSVKEQVAFRRLNPRVPIREYNTEQLDDEWRLVDPLRVEEKGLTRKLFDFNIGPSHSDLALQGYTLGIGDEAAGLGTALNNIATAPFTDVTFSPWRAYQVGRDRSRNRLDAARRQLGWLGTAAEFGGGGAGVNFRSLFAARTPLTRVKQGGSIGARDGATAGWGSGDGLIDSASGGAAGAVTGYTGGVLLPTLGYAPSLLRTRARTLQLQKDVTKGAISRSGGVATPAQTDWANELYRGMGHHIEGQAKARKAGWTREQIDHPRNVFKAKTNREMAVLHALTDPYYWGGRIPEKFGGGTWNAKRLGITAENKYNDLEQVVFTTPEAKRALVLQSAATGNAAAGSYWLDGYLRRDR